jgi:3-oxoadipate enol-lactonase
MSVQKIYANGIEFAYRFDGPVDAPVVMMAHAMGTSHQIWDYQMEALTRHFRVLRYDWRGHGNTDAPEGPYSLDQFDADAIAVMDALDLRKVHWVGISTGGMIGQGLGIRHNDRLASLCLCNTTSQASPWYRNWVAERQAAVRQGGMPPVWEMTKSLWFTDAYVAAADARYQHIQRVFEATPIQGYLGGTSAVADLAYQRDLHNIRARTLLIAAGADPVTPMDHAHAIRDAIEGVEFHVIDDQRHFSNVEVPEAFNAILVPFLLRAAGLDVPR